MPNPFYCCTPIHDPRYFVGRERELARIYAALDVTHTGQMQSVSIVGERRMGRSSLLLHMVRNGMQLPQAERMIMAYVDLQQGQYETQHGLLSGMLDLLVEKLPPTAKALRRGLRREQRDKELTLAEFEAAISKFQTEVEMPLLPVICLDEFEQLVKYPEQFSKRLFDSWRSLIGAGKIAFVITSTKPLYELADEEKLTSQFFNIFGEYIALDELTEAEAYRLAERGRKCDRSFEDEDIQRVLDWGGRHPLRLQQAGKAVYQAMAQTDVDWDKEKKMYDTLIRQTFGQRTRRHRFWRWLGDKLEIVGKMVLFWKGSDGTDARVFRLVGTIFVLVIIALVVGFIFFPLVRQWVAIKLEFPTPTPLMTATPVGTPTP